MHHQYTRCNGQGCMMAPAKVALSWSFKHYIITSKHLPAGELPCVKRVRVHTKLQGAAAGLHCHQPDKGEAPTNQAKAAAANIVEGQTFRHWPQALAGNPFSSYLA
jgi:hypothetical protein